MPINKRLSDSNLETQLRYSRPFSLWELTLCALIPDQEVLAANDEPEKSLAIARLEAHYFVNNGFFETDNFILENINAIKHIKTHIIQGRYDLVCPAYFCIRTF